MAKHDLKAQTLQAEFLDNLIQLFIQARVPIRMASSDIDLSHPLSLITREILEEYTNGGIPLIAPWDGVETPVNYYRTHFIDGKEYLFRSLVNDNVSEPTLESAGWEKDGEIAGLIPSWSSLTTYSTGQYVRISQNVDGTLYNYAFKSKSDGNLNNNPLNFDNVYWTFLGGNRGAFVDGTVYDNMDVVTGDDGNGNAVFISLYDNNTIPLTSTGSTWQLIGSADSSKSFIEYTQASLQPEYEGSYYLSVDVPSGKVPIAIERIQGGQTYYMPININAGILGGFPNDNSQTIRIYFI